MKILIVEDNTALLKAYKLKFDKATYEVYYSKDGQEAVDLALDIKPDLILMDLIMPKLTGWEAIKQIREAGSKAYIIAITNMVADEEEKTLKLGADEFVKKSDIKIDDLVKKVEAKLDL